MTNRAQVLATLRKRAEVSVLIVGGGINGIGTFRDLALNGVDALLIDRGDFCSGTSAASSRMAHGGIRYLENGDFRLVREAVRERNYMIKHAPHMVQPLPTTIPIFRRYSGLLNAPLKFLGLLDRPAERGSLVIKIGLMLYDAYTGTNRTVPRHRFLGREASLQKWRELNPAIVHTATYFDGAILHPERLGLELILDAEAANSDAHALNYVSLRDRRSNTIILQDETTGEDYEVRPRVVVNAAGPWIDLVNGGLATPTRYIGGTKGSHIVLNNPELRAAIGQHEFFFENKDGRIVLIFPLFDRVLIGTSDIPVSNPDDVRCTEEEVDYFIGLVKHVFPTIDVQRKEIVFRFSGVRPLAKSESKTPGQISRDHEVRQLSPATSGPPFPIYSLVGGKWTSWRAFSELASQKVLEFLGWPRKVDTRMLDVGGGVGFPQNEGERRRLIADIATRCDQPAARAEMLLDRYGTVALIVADYLGAGEDVPLSTLPTYTRRELAFMVERERVVHLDDILLRRTNLALLGRLNHASVEEIAGELAACMGWNADKREAELARAHQILRDRHQVNLQ